MSIKYFSMFSGIGGFELGIGDKGECVGYSEIDRYAIQIYEKHFAHKNFGDATKINADELPDFDLLVGGFPCQAFSIAGKRHGFDDTRGTLFFDIARILKAKRPRNFILENVKGLLSHDNGRTFKTIISTLTELGYCVEWQVLNAKNFGVPQNRERVFIVGHLGGIPGRQVFPIGESGAISNKSDEGGVQAEISGTLGATNYKRQHTQTYIKQLNNPTHSNDRVYGKEGISPALNTMQGGRRQPKIVAHYGHKNKPPVEMNISPTLKANSHGHEPMVITQKPAEADLSKSSTLEQSRNNTVSISDILEKKITEPLYDEDTGGYDYLRSEMIRRLTPLECERLMSYPDGWTEYGTQGKISDTQRYKTLGNGIVSNVVKEIVENLS